MKERPFEMNSEDKQKTVQGRIPFRGKLVTNKGGDAGCKAAKLWARMTTFSAGAAAKGKVPP